MWEVEDAADIDVRLVIVEHDPPDRDGHVYIGAGLASIKSHEDTVEELADGGFNADALTGERNE